MATRWSQSLRSLGDALIDVLRAEAAVLGDDLGRTGRSLLKVLVLAFMALAIVFWTIGALTLALIEVLALWLPRWGATLSVVGLFVATIALVGLLAWLRMRKLEAPTVALRRRVDEHLDWWQQNVLHPVAGEAGSRVGEADAAETQEDRPS